MKIFGELIVFVIYNYVLSVLTVSAEKNCFQLSSGHCIPSVGFGLHGFTNRSELETLLPFGLRNGLRHFDTSFSYGNEEIIGDILEDWLKGGGQRQELFIVSKLPYYDNNPEAVEIHLKRSLKNLKIEYIDLYLIHAPFGVLHKNGSYEIATIDKNRTVALDCNVDHIAIWKALEKQVDAGLIKSIGLSNFNETQISKLLNGNIRIKPSNLQIEVHLYHQQKSLRKFCEEHNIVVTAYAPLGSPGSRKSLRPEQKPGDFPNPLTLPIVQDIAKKYNISTAQVLLSHTIQGKAAVIPSSHSVEYLKQNLQAANITLSQEDVETLNKLDKGEEGKIFNYKRVLKGIEKHPEYPFNA